MSSNHLFRELRRRHIFRIAAVYAATVWLVLQLGAIVFPALHAPSWCLPVLIGFIALGFPVALVLAWAFEVTPEGVRRTEAAGPVNRRRVGQALNVAIIVILAVAVGVLTWRLNSRRNTATQSTSAKTQAANSSTTIPANSIAVLPFLDLSPKGNQAYFAEGVSEQLLDILAQSTNLKVAARTSAFQFKGKPENVVKIGRILRVRHVLEGSVRRDRDLVRITVQLINARTDYHEWSKTYQRKMTDIFKVQDEISKAIADALEVRFSTASETAAVAKVDPETVPKAYDQYLLGRHLVNRRTGESLQEAITHFKKAIELDPGYAPAYAQIAIATSLLVKGSDAYGNYTPTEANALAKPYLDKAVALAPDAPETLAAEGRYAVLGHKYQKALGYFSRAVKANPSYMDAVTWLAQGLQFSGQYSKALEVYAEGTRRDPLNWILNDNYMEALLSHQEFDQACAVAERFINLTPTRAQLMLGDIEAAQGRAAAALKHYLIALQTRPNGQIVTEDVRSILLDAGLYEEAHRIRVWDDGGLSAAIAGDRDQALKQARLNMEQHQDEVFVHGQSGLVYAVLGDHADAKHQFDRTWEMARQRGQDLWDYLPADIAYAALLQESGERDKANEALSQARKFINEHHEKAIAAGIDWSDYYQYAAEVKILSGDKKAGLKDLQKAVEQKGLDFTGLKHLEVWPQYDSVRSDPRFKTIVKLAAKRQALLRTKILPVLCNWHYPADSWHPLPVTCKGVAKAAPAASSSY